MSGMNIIFDDEKINKSNFYRNKRLFKIHLNTILDMMIMTPLDHFV